MGELIRRNESPVVVIRGARALARNHGGAKRFAGSAFLAESWTLVRLQNALQHFPAVAQWRLDSMNAADLEAVLGIELAVLGTQLPAAGGNHADAAPCAIDYLENLFQQFLGREIPLKGDDAFISIIDPRFARFELQNGAANPFKNVERLKAGDDDRDTKTLGQRRILVVTHDTADVASGKEGLNRVSRRLHDCRNRGRHQDVRDQRREVLQSMLACDMDGHGVCRSCCLEAHAKKDDLFIWVLAGDLDGIERRINDSNVSALAANTKQIFLAAGNTQHVAEGAEDHAGLGRDG